MISTFTCTARMLRSTLDSIATPCSVNARGRFRVPPQLDLPKWNIKFSNSAAVNWNMKSFGKRSRFRVTALFKLPVVTPYSAARSLSRITLCPRISRMACSIRLCRDQCVVTRHIQALSIRTPERRLSAARGVVNDDGNDGNDGR